MTPSAFTWQARQSSGEGPSRGVCLPTALRELSQDWRCQCRHLLCAGQFESKAERGRQPEQTGALLSGARCSLQAAGEAAGSHRWVADRQAAGAAGKWQEKWGARRLHAVSQWSCILRGQALLPERMADANLLVALRPADEARLRFMHGLMCCSRKGLKSFDCRLLRITPCTRRVWQPQGCPLQVHLEWLEREEALKMEPHLHCVAALWSSNTAIVDSHRSVNALYYLR